MNNILLVIENVEPAKIINRPSKISKTPYVADIILNNNNNNNDNNDNNDNDNIIYQAHSPSLGCCGLCEKDSNVLVYPLISKNVCKYRIFLSEFYEKDKEYIGYIGIEPKMAENIVENAIKNNNLSKLQNVKSFKREIKMLNSRFDFIGIDENDNTFILEVKNVPLADYADLSLKEKKLLNFDNKNFNEKIAYFPDGYRKNKGNLVSERAFKHINELKQIKINTTNTKLSNTRCIICFVIQRDDISSFQVSNLDKIYKEAFNDAINYGVEIITIVTQWDYDEKNKLSQCKFIKDNLLINL